ncbi:hypothetical protein SVA_2765 [Sulfurifustis variabilis]|uniref:Uncharacterized protein n=1 Tax=Sulfurifustis variabilis TaxID=1675686 RepID=A0A1B4V6Z8_9GAMM|nr:hypothetical protein [Sulfurifustis variabilis]BAU49313.1 hypothetical protein SVA_2765 [Sulfurifustis variabilis]
MIRSPHLIRRGVVALLASLALGAVIAGAPPPAEADDYLSAINAEGDRLESLGKARRERELLERRVSQPAAATPVAADQAQFERELNAEFPASYALYSMMGADDRTKVYAEYRESRSGGAARFFPVLNRIIALSTKNR